MFLIDKEQNRIQKIEEKTFAKLGFKEREHLQKWIANNPDALGEELLIIQEEFDRFDDTRERLDLLALDKSGNTVVIENKLDDSGRDVTWQILKYASYCASLSKQQLKIIYQAYLDKLRLNESAERNLSEFLNVEDFEEIQLNKHQRLVMVAGNFRKEVTSTVLWLLNNYKLRIQCFKVTPYSLNNQLFLNIEQIIPIKEAEEYIIKMAEKTQEDVETQDELKLRHKIRFIFWEQLLDTINNTDYKSFQNISPSNDNWITAGVGMSGVGLNLVVGKNFARTELQMFRTIKEENKFIYDELLKDKTKIESEFKDKLKWERLDNKKSCRIKFEKTDVNLYEKDDWDVMTEFLIDGISRMEKVFKNRLKSINQKLKKRISEESNGSNMNFHNS